MEIVIEWRDGLVEVVSASEADAGLGPGARTAAVMARARLAPFDEKDIFFSVGSRMSYRSS